MKRRPGRPPKMGTPMTSIGLRLPPDILRRVEAYAAHLAELRPGAGAGISDAIRLLIIEGLDRNKVS